MMVGRAGFTAYSWTDYSFCVMTGGWCGASADDLEIYSTAYLGTTGDMLNGGPTASNQLIPAMNNLTYSDAVYNTGDAGRSPFVYSYPITHSDWLGRRVCSATGWQAGGQDIVYVDGLPYIKPFAPTKSRTAELLDGFYF